MSKKKGSQRELASENESEGWWLCAGASTGGRGVGTADWMFSVISSHPLPWTLPSTLAAPSAQGTLELRVGLFSALTK